jgi:myo-inositol-1(or 4)-monophosphatase
MERSLEEHKDVNFEEAEKFLTQLLPEAGKIVKSYFEKGGWRQEQKEGINFTTQADTETDEFLRTEISRRYPNHQFLTEETQPSFSCDPKTIEKLWVIDPLDGTGNFSTHDPHFAISVALVSKGKPILAATYAPMFDELYLASANSPFATCNGEEIKVSDNEDLKKAIVRVDWAWDLKRRPVMAEIISKLSDKVRFVLIKGSVVLDLSRLARGDFDAYIHMGLKPWDMAAASLLVTKAGGIITTPDGKPWNVFTPEIFAASNTAIHQKILAIISDQSQNI